MGRLFDDFTKFKLIFAARKSPFFRWRVFTLAFRILILHLSKFYIFSTVMEVKITCFTDTLGIKRPIVVITLSCFLGSSFLMITVSAHSFSIINGIWMWALVDYSFIRGSFIFVDSLLFTINYFYAFFGRLYLIFTVFWRHERNFLHHSFIGLCTQWILYTKPINAFFIR